MKSAEKPANERERIAKLRELNILDTPVEERFERITRIVCRTLNVPIAAISLVDSERQWFKSIQGLSSNETPRDLAFCSHAILQEGPFIVSDASEDPRFADNPLVTDGPNIRFYAGCPIEMGDGVRIGTLCAIDDEPRAISEDDIKTLRDLTEMVISELQVVALSEAHLSLISDLEEAQRAALIDPVSRLWNRSGIDNLIWREWEYNVRNQEVLSMLLIELDDAASVNDQHGEDGHDALIQHTAGVLLGVLRPYDTVARWGKSQFMVLLPGCSDSILNQTAQRILEAFREAAFRFDDVRVSGSISLGGTSINYRDPGAPDDFIKIAEHALHQARSAGGDRALIPKILKG